MSELDALPHGPEFRFVDEVLTLVPGKHALGRYRIRGGEDFLKGHFPGNPLMPGVILIEAIAQLGGVVAQTDREIKPLANLLLTGVRGAKIFGAAGPGELLEIEATVEGRLGGMIQISGRVSAGGRELATAKIMLSGQEQDDA